jgi:hypothetical protein
MLVLTITGDGQGSLEALRDALHAGGLPVTLSDDQLSLGSLGSVEVARMATGWRLTSQRAHFGLSYAVALALGGAVQEDGAVVPPDSVRKHAAKPPVVFDDSSAAEALDGARAGDARCLRPLYQYVFDDPMVRTLAKERLVRPLGEVALRVACRETGRIAVIAANIALSCGRRPATPPVDPEAAAVFTAPGPDYSDR